MLVRVIQELDAEMRLNVQGVIRERPSKRK